MFKEQDRVRFIDAEKDKQFGVLTIQNIKGRTVTFIIGDPYLAQGIDNADISELKLAE
ncbi:MAG TPA: hypothetical protein PLL29_08185 [Paludibacteraceae bacterium]|nr:hypothetical protein [Paludibacteraceae bacterium]